jgi:hypothetical protein
MHLYIIRLIHYQTNKGTHFQYEKASFVMVY